MALKRCLAYTLLEVLVTVGVIGGVAAGTYLVVSHTTDASARAKLEQDVSSLNRAIQVYITHGGKLPDGMSGDAVLTKLRREAANPRLAGIKGSLIDPRMTIRWQESGEATGGSLRAYWDDTAKKFVLATGGSAPGVKEFYAGDLLPVLPPKTGDDGKELDPNLDPDRMTTTVFASVDKWVWDYNSGGGVGRKAPGIVPATDVEPVTGSAPPDANAVPLPPPLFSSAGGTYDLSWYPRDLTLSLPSTVPTGAAEIYCYATGGQWERYAGPIALSPGMSVTAKSVSLDPDHFMDSPERMETYQVNKVTLALSTTLLPSYRYAELGGPLAPGSPPAVLAPTPTIVLSNALELPDQWENSDVFQTFWTWDGSDPSTLSEPGFRYQ
jgi:type II secretory pathway pseudopilin PulG